MSGSITGTVIDANGNTVSGATVSAISTKTSALIGTDTSNSSGQFSIPYTGGDYKLTAESPAADTQKDSLSLGLGFTAVQASY